MAKAVKSQAKKKVTRVENEDVVVLTLSPMEAAALFAVCGRICGGPNTTVRGYTRRIYYALMGKVSEHIATQMSKSIKMDLDAGALDFPHRPSDNPEVVYE